MIVYNRYPGIEKKVDLIKKEIAGGFSCHLPDVYTRALQKAAGAQLTDSDGHRA